MKGRRTILMLAKIRMLARSKARLGAPIVSVLALLAVLAMTPAAAQARNGGIDGRTDGCNPCHGGTPSGIAVSITGPGSLALGGTGLYTLTIAAGLQGGALDIGTSAGTLAAVAANTALSGGEIVHVDANDNLDGIYSFDFNLTAPGVAGTLTLAAAGMQFSGDFNNSAADLWNTALLLVDVPEPGTVLLLGMGLAGLAVVSRRRRA
jgi:hypothetical protein